MSITEKYELKNNVLDRTASKRPLINTFTVVQIEPMTVIKKRRRQKNIKHTTADVKKNEKFFFRHVCLIIFKVTFNVNSHS